MSDPTGVRACGQTFELSRDLFQHVTLAPTRLLVLIVAMQEAESTRCYSEEEHGLYVNGCEVVDRVARTINDDLILIIINLPA